MNIVMDEEEYAKMLLEGNAAVAFKERSYATAVIAKYYRALGYDDKGVKNSVGLFVEKQFPDASGKSAEFLINRAAATAKKYPLFKISEIMVTDKEVDTIRSLHSEKFKSEKLQRLAFTLLCFSKFEAAKGRKDGWVNTDRKRIFLAADLKNVKTEKQLLYIHELCKAGYLDVSLKIGSGGMKVLGYADGENVIVVDDINEAGYVFEEYEGRRFIRCDVCGKRVPVTNGRNKYCHDCAANVDREKARERMRKALNV